MTYQVANLAFDTRAQAINAAVSAFLTADGLNSPDEIAAAHQRPEATADEMIAGWGPIELTGATHDEMDDEWSHELEFATREELIEAIRAYEA